TQQDRPSRWPSLPVRQIEVLRRFAEATDIRQGEGEEIGGLPHCGPVPACVWVLWSFLRHVRTRAGPVFIPPGATTPLYTRRMEITSAGSPAAPGWNTPP